jgi:hypothetical protein
MLRRWRRERTSTPLLVPVHTIQWVATKVRWRLSVNTIEGRAQRNA